MKILAIDDNEDNLVVIEALITDAFPQVDFFIAQSGERGIELACSQKPDVILLDLLMPGMDGFEICKKIKSDASIKHIPIIVLTAMRADKASRQKAIENGADAFLSKPVNKEELQTQIQAMYRIKISEDALRNEKDLLEKKIIERTLELQNELEKHKETENLFRETLEKLEKGKIAMLNLMEDLQQEVNDRKMAEQALIKNRELLNETERMAKIGGWEFDVNTLTQKWTDETFRILEVDFNKGEPKVPEGIDFYTPQSKPILEKAIQRAIEYGEPYDLELEIITAKGNKRWVNAVAKVNQEECKTRSVSGTFQDITERKQAEEALRLQGEILQNMSEGVQLTRASDGVIIFANPRFELMFGYQKGELLGKNVSILNAPGDQKPEDVATNIMKCLLQTNAWSGEVYNIRKDGSTFWCHANVTAFNHPEYGKIWISVHVDITERKQAQEAIQHKNKVLTIINEYSKELTFQPPDRINKFIVNKLKEFTNAMAVVMTKYDPKISELIVNASTLNTEQNSKIIQILGKKIDGLRSPVSQEMYKEISETTIGNAQSINEVTFGAIPKFIGNAIQKILGISCFTGVALMKDKQLVGTIMIVESAATTRMDHEFLLAFSGITANALERKRAEEALSSEKERLAVTLRSIGDGVITTDIEGNLVIMNKIAENLTGWSQNEAQGKPLTRIFNIVNEITRKPCENPVEKVIKTGNIIELANHTLLISRDGTEYIIADSGAPIKDKNSETIGVVLVFRDMTEKQKMLNNMQRIDKLDSLGVLAGGIAHDFNNLLSGIFGYIEMARKTSTDEKTSRYLEKSMSVFTRAKDLTQQLITFSKGGEPLKKTGSLALLIKDSTSFILSGSKVTCLYSIADDLWLCDFDANQIGQVIDNIVINAQQAMPLGGIIRISAENVLLDKSPPIPLRPGRYIRISIADTGVGIPHDLLNRIFDPFFTTKHKGNGLGLATCYAIIQKHEGYIDVESQQAKGSIFHIYLPASDKEIAKSSESEIAIHKGTGKILIMDDEDFIRELAGELLQEMGYGTIEAKDGVEALKILDDSEKRGQSIIGAILDLTIPGGMGGKETAAQIRKLYPHIKIFASSGYSEDPVICRPTDFGFTSSIQKPYKMEDLAEMLNRHLK